MAETLQNMRAQTSNGSTDFINPVPAAEFSTTTAYAKGAYVTYQGYLYRFTAAKSAGAWSSSVVTQVTLAADVQELNAFMDQYTQYDDLMQVVKITSSSTTMGDINTTLTAINTEGDHVVFDVASLNAGMYLCTIYINQGYYRIADLVTGFVGTGFYNANDLLYDVITSGSSSSEDHYTFVWDQTTAKGTRLNAAASITTDTSNFGHFGSVNANYDNPFDDIYPWSGRKLCNIDIDSYMNLTSSDDITDCVTYWEDDTGFSYTDTYGVWVYTPPFYGRTYISGNYRYFDVTEENTLYNTYYPAQITGRWHGCPVTLTIDGSSKICNLPISGALSFSNVAVSTQHTYAKNFGASLTDVYSNDASALLFVVEYATMGSQAAIGNGVSDLYDQATLYPSAAASSSTTVKFSGLSSAQLADFIVGAEIDFGTSSGGYNTARTFITAVSTTSGVTTVTLNDAVTVTTSTYASIHGLANVADEDIGSMSGYIGTNGKCNAYYRGEVLWGNKYQYLLGIYRQTGTNSIYVADRDDTDNYDALNTTYHTDTGLDLATVSSASWNYINELGVADGFCCIPVETAIGGGSTNPVGDAQYIPLSSAGNTICLSGGGAAGGASVGLFCAAWDYASSNSLWSGASRPRLKNPS